MALIGCPECGREVSSSAVTCPTCAFPLTGRAADAPSSAGKERLTDPWWKVAVPIFMRLAIGGWLIAWGLNEYETAGVVGGSIIAGSSIPAWYGAVIARLKANRQPVALDGRYDDRLAELEQRHRDQMDSMEHALGEQITDLEERIEFTERLVARNREQLGPGK